MVVNTPKLSRPGARSSACILTDMDKAGACSLLGKRKEWTAHHHVREPPQGSGSLSHAGQNTKCFPKPPAHCAQLPEQVSSPILGSPILGKTLHKALKWLTASSAFPSPHSRTPRPESIPHVKDSPGGSPRLPPSSRAQTHTTKHRSGCRALSSGCVCFSSFKG